MLVVLCLMQVTPSRAGAPPSIDDPLPRLRTWTLTARELAPSPAPPPAYLVRLEMGIVAGTVWQPAVILDAARGAAAILAQCDINISQVQLHEFDGPSRFRHFRTRDSREFARRSALRKPAVYFVDDTLQRPAFDAEAIGRANAGTRPEMADTVWITAGIRDLPIALAHELVHVLTDSGEHSGVPGNLMRDDTAPENTKLSAEQCANILINGQAHGLVDARDDAGAQRQSRKAAQTP